MKLNVFQILFLVPMLFTANTNASPLLKKCAVSLKETDFSKPMNLTIRIFSKGRAFSALITQEIGNEVANFNTFASISEMEVRQNFVNDSNRSELNRAERLVRHAMVLTSEPMMKGAYSAGIDLSAVRKARLYTVGDANKMGSTTIVEAYDQKDLLLGSFLGGFFLSPCKMNKL